MTTHQRLAAMNAMSIVLQFLFVFKQFSDTNKRAWTYEMPDGKLEQFQVAGAN
jgi:hypothetical protein